MYHLDQQPFGQLPTDEGTNERLIEMVQKEYIRFLHFREGKSLRAISRITGLHRNTVTKALQDSETPRYKRTAPIVHPVLGPFIPVINAWLEEDQNRPPKQRHTAKRIYDRLCEPPYNFTGGETTVRDYVRKQRKKLKEVFVPLEFGPAESAQCDWGEATVFDNGLERTVHVFCMRLCYSGDIFIRLYPNQRQEAFFDGICQGLEFFGGVPRELVFDNLKTAVKRILVGREREEQEAFARLRTHYVFEARFCNPASGNEKGMVENLVGYGRRNFLVPVPETSDLDELNEMLLARCAANRQRRKHRRDETVQQLLETERSQMLPLPAERFDCCIRRTVNVDHCSRFRFETNWYSVPHQFAGRELTLKAYVDRLELFHVDRLVTTHRRSYGRQEDHLELDHYLEVLMRKPGALRDAKPWRQAAVPHSYRRLFDELKTTSRGCRDFIQVLLLRRDGDAKVVDNAVETAVANGLRRRDVIEQLIAQAGDVRPIMAQAHVTEHLQSITVPPMDLKNYDALSLISKEVSA